MQLLSARKAPFSADGIDSACETRLSHTFIIPIRGMTSAPKPPKISGWTGCPQETCSVLLWGLSGGDASVGHACSHAYFGAESDSVVHWFAFFFHPQKRSDKSSLQLFDVGSGARADRCPIPREIGRSFKSASPSFGQIRIPDLDLGSVI